MDDLRLTLGDYIHVMKSKGLRVAMVPSPGLGIFVRLYQG